MMVEQLNSQDRQAMPGTCSGREHAGRARSSGQPWPLSGTQEFLIGPKQAWRGYEVRQTAGETSIR